MNIVSNLGFKKKRAETQNEPKEESKPSFNFSDKYAREKDEATENTTKRYVGKNCTAKLSVLRKISLPRSKSLLVSPSLGFRDWKKARSSSSAAMKPVTTMGAPHALPLKSSGSFMDRAVVSRAGVMPSLRSGSIAAIAREVEEFIWFADSHPDMTFLVTRICCGIAGYTDEEIVPLFARAYSLPNVYLPAEFWKVLSYK